MAAWADSCITSPSLPALGQCRDVDEAVDTRTQLDEGAERLQPDDLALDPRALRQIGGRGLPGIFLSRPQRQGDPLLLLRLVRRGWCRRPPRTCPASACGTSRRTSRPRTPVPW